jgi:ADP-ribose pyrophosphatase YjhB (NUDIX family)
MKESSDFSVTEIETLISIANKLGIELPSEKSASVEFYLNAIQTQLTSVPYTPFPIAFHTVDIAPLKQSTEKHLELLLGRKPGKVKFQFIGGFMEPAEKAQEAAARELFEESNIQVFHSEMRYVDSYFVKDKRFENSCHKITTSFFCTFVSQLQSEVIKAKDDIEEVKWFDLSILEQDPTIIAPLHLPLFEGLLICLKQNGI